MKYNNGQIVWYGQIKVRLIERMESVEGWPYWKCIETFKGKEYIMYILESLLS